MPTERYAILCVDDEHDLLSALRAQLRSGLGGSYAIETAEDGEEGEEVFDELIADGFQVPVVIADYVMPRVKGDELLRRIHAVSPECRKILLIGHATAEAVGNAVRYAGLYRYLAKPLDMQDLLLTVNEALGAYFQTRKLLRFNRGLEARIEARTAELAEKNQALQQEIAERKRVEMALLEARDAAETANRAKGEFLAGISHDLRTPLNAVLGYAELLNGPIDEQRRIEYAQLIAGAGRTLLALIDDLLTLSRAEAGRLSLEPRPVSLPELLNDAARLFMPQLQQAGLDLDLQLPADTPPIVMLDPARLRQVLDNLIANAIKFTEQGRITVQAEYTPVSATAIDLSLSVSDTGIGIAAEHWDNIFEAFEQQPGQSQRRYQGSGLGLAICRQLLTLMGGDIRVDSELGKGSRFDLRLPAVAIAPQQIPAPVATPKPSATAPANIATPAPLPPPALVDALVEYGLPLLLQSGQHPSINRLQQLHTDMLALAQQHDYPPLTETAEALGSALQRFDTRELTRVLQQVSAFY